MKIIALTIFIFLSINSFGAERYANAKIERVEACNSNGHHILLMLKEISGTTPSVSNGCSNDASFPFVRIASDQYPSGLNESLLSIALTAFASGKTIRIRYDDEINQVRSIAVMY